jgi:tetratricopeptide (TPR) repeat protein
MMLDLRSIHPDDPLISNLIGSYYYRTNRPQLSVEVMRESMERNPEIEDCALQYLLLLYTLQSWPELAEDATVAIQRFPTNQDLLQLRAIANNQQKNYEAAVEDYQAILKLNPRDTTVAKVTYASIGDTYYQLGDSKKAFSYYEKALKIDPDYNPVLNNYAYYLSLRKKDLKRAEEMSRKSNELDPDNATYLDTYAWVLFQLKRYEEAKQYMDKVVELMNKEGEEIDGDVADHIKQINKKVKKK